MANTLVLLERITVGAAGATSVTFNSIPQTGYTDLVLKVSARTTRGTTYDWVKLTFNGSTTAAYSDRILLGSGAAASSSSDSAIAAIQAGLTNADSATASSFGNLEYYIPNYTSANYKSVSVDTVNETNGTTAYSSLVAGLWSNTAAITSITFTPDSGGASYMQYSTFSLYGVSAVGTTPTKAPKALGGNIIETDGTYWYHAFLSSGTFTPAVGLSCDVLVVGGGGGGLYAGGGAGGVFYATSQALTANTGYTTTIGSGGTGGNPTSTAGGDSQFGSLTLAKGGGAAISTNSGTAGSGGSGAGVYYLQTAGTSNQSSTGGTGYGNSGGSNPGGKARGAAGGGGAGAAGADYATIDYGGAGGAGLNTWSAWATATSTGVSGYYAGGGGGAGNVASGAGGSGGGGAGSTTVSGTAGTANTGGGGGGTWTANGGNGGSGLIIVRYAA